MTRIYMPVVHMVEAAGEPISQTHYRRIRGTYTWTLVNHQRRSPPEPLPNKVEVVSWCIGHILPHPELRMTSVLDNIKSCNIVPGIIFFQDVHVLALQALLLHPWVMEFYHVTDVDGSNWSAGTDANQCQDFGTMALVRRDLDMLNVFRVPLVGESGRFTRDALVLDFEDRRGGIVRFISTNLGVSARAALFAALAQYTPAYGSDAASTVVVGEVGVEIAPPLEAQLRDVFLSMGRSEEDSNGWTWGLNCFPKMWSGERRQRAYISTDLVADDFGRIGAGNNTPLIASERGDAVYASENNGVLLMLSLSISE